MNANTNTLAEFTRQSTVVQHPKPAQHSQPPTYGVYVRSLLSMKVALQITEIGRQVKQNLERKIVKQTEGKCIPQGFIRPNSVRIVSYSSGNVKGDIVEFSTVYECLVCHPVENMIVDCTTKTITKAGIHAEVITDENVIPLTIFVARDHNYTNRDFDRIKENANIKVRILGIRYELNDPYICAIGMLVNPNAEKRRQPTTQVNRVVVSSEDADAGVDELPPPSDSDDDA